MEIKLFDYEEDDGWGWVTHFGIGQGRLSAATVVPLIEAAGDEDITVRINSFGGLVFDGFAIYNALVKHRNTGKKIFVSIEGIAASIASVIAMAGTEVTICSAAMIMIHKPSVSLWYCESMTADQLQAEADALNQVQAVLNSIYRAKTGLDEAAVESLINATTWFTPNECVTLGFADRIEGTIAPITVTENMFKQLFTNAEPKILAYANKSFKINNKMSDVKETMQAVKDSTASTNKLINWLTEKFKTKNEGDETVEVVNTSIEKEDGTSLYYTGDLEVGTSIFTDEAMTVAAADGDHLLDDGRTLVLAAGLVTEIKEAAITEDNVETENAADAATIADLQAENATLREALTASQSNVTNLTNAIQTLKNVKSNGIVPEKKANFSKTTKPDAAAASTFDPEAVKARKEELLKNKQKTK